MADEGKPKSWFFHWIWVPVVVPLLLWGAKEGYDEYRHGKTASSKASATNETEKKSTVEKKAPGENGTNPNSTTKKDPKPQPVIRDNKSEILED